MSIVYDTASFLVLVLWGVGILTVTLILLKNAIQYFLARKHLKGLLAAVGALGIIAFAYAVFLMPRLHRLHKRPPGHSCRGNLHKLDLVLQAYCYPPVENYPTNLAEIDPRDVSPKVFVCSLSRNLPGDLTNVMEWTDYIYFSGVGPVGPATVPVLICPPMFHQIGSSRWHPRMGGNALMGDHSCDWYPDAAYLDKLIEDPLAFCPNAPASLRSNIYVHVSKRITEQSKGKYRSHGLK